MERNEGGNPTGLRMGGTESERGGEERGRQEENAVGGGGAAVGGGFSSIQMTMTKCMEATMSVYTIIRDWLNWCKKTGIIDAFLNDGGTMPEKSQTQASNGRGEKQDGGLEKNSSDSEKQVATYLDRAVEMRRKAKDYLAKGLRGMAENCIQSYNEYIRLAEGLDEGMQTLTTMKMEARATQALGDLADTLQDAMDRRQEQEEQFRTNMDKLKDLHLRSLEIRDRMRSFGGNHERSYKEGDLTCESLEEELAQEIQAETDRSVLAEAMAKGNNDGQSK